MYQVLFVYGHVEMFIDIMELKVKLWNEIVQEIYFIPLVSTIYIKNVSKVCNHVVCLILQTILKFVWVITV